MKKFVIKSVEIRIVEANYESGQMPETETSQFPTSFRGEMFNTVEELILILGEPTINKECFVAFEDRIIVSYMCDDRQLPLSALEEEEWKAGRFVAYQKTIDVQVSVIEEYNATQKEIAELLLIQNY